jgi:hypothetical protein
LIGDASAYLGVTYTKASGITTGTTYKFRIKARNQWGDGDFSSDVSILAASAPATMSAPITSIHASGDVVITWVAPSANG